MATYSAIPSTHGDGMGNGDVPPMPALPKAVRLASGEVINIPASKTNLAVPRAKLQHPPSNAGKLSKARPTPSPKKGGEAKGCEKTRKGDREAYEWPEDVF